MMSEVIRGEAFAKTNLSLRVSGRRPDGYHELDTVFQTIDLADEIEVRLSEEISLECDDPAIPLGEENLVIRAARNLSETLGAGRGARIVLKKRIPPGGGLGGGSSDAALTLMLLSRLWKLAPTEKELARMAAGIGSDVPFFLLGGTARGTGRGEMLTPLPDRPPTRIVVIVPPFAISTAGVYREFRAGSEGDTESFEANRGLGKSEERLFGANHLAQAVIRVKPEMARYVETLSGILADCQISGSGSSLVAALSGDEEEVFADLEAALPEARVLRARTVSRPEWRRRTGAALVNFKQEVGQP
jgi:4-diphosphocytidyl-2-C-methyl-D-erythritol kinase